MLGIVDSHSAASVVGMVNSVLVAIVLSMVQFW